MATHDVLSPAAPRRTLTLACLLMAAFAAGARADDCMRLVEALPSRTFGDGTHTLTLTPPAASLGQWFVAASGDDPAWVEVDGRTVVSPSDLRGARRDRVVVGVKLRATSRLKVRVPGRCDRLAVRVFGVAPASALPPGVGAPVGDVVVLDERLPGGFPPCRERRTVTVPGADGVLFLSAEQAGSAPVHLAKLLWNHDAVLGPNALGPNALGPNCRPGGGPSVSPVPFCPTNTLDTWTLGPPGSRLRVRLRGWIVDRQPPTAAWASPAPDGATAGPGMTLRLTWADAGTGVDPDRTKITLNGHDVTAAFTLGASEATAPFASLPASSLVAGTNVLRATVRDRACNAVTAERRFTTDVTPPDTTPPVLGGTPADLTVEQTGPAGAVVTYTAPVATDDRDPAPVVTCVPPSGSTFTAGTTTVVCTATDAAGNTSTSTFTVTVRDSTPPVLSAVPADQVAEQTGPLGAVVTYTAPTAADAVDPTVAVVCSPVSGSLLPAGTTTVTCTARDAAGNASTSTFQVTVRDTTPPVLAGTPATLTVEQTGPAGSVVTYAAPTATDAADPAPVVSCVPASGSLFPAGATTVTCTARDAAGNASTSTFTVTVRDRTAPTFAGEPPDLTVEQTGPAGAVVTYAVPVATDAVDPSVEVHCTPAPGTLFPPGHTLVVCAARDDAGNLRSVQFVVQVRDSAPPALAVVEPAAGATVGPQAQLRVTYGDAVGVWTPSLAVRVNGRDVTALLDVGPTAALARLADLGLDSGPVQVEASVADLHSNVTTATSAFTLVVPPIATTLAIEVPPAPGAPLLSGQPYDLTLRALTATGEVAATFTGVVVLTTTDPASLLNGLVVDFAASHAGVRTLRGVARFEAPGAHTVTATTVLGVPLQGQLDLVIERSERGRVIAVLPTGAYFPGQTLSARIFVDLGTSDGDPTTLHDALGGYDLRLLYDPRQVEIVRVDPGSSSLGSPLFRLPGSVRLMDLNDLGTLSEAVGPDPAATGLVEVASIDLFLREGAPGGALSLAVTGDALTTAVPAADQTLLLSPVGGAGPRPGELEGEVLVVSGVPPAGPVVLGVLPREGDGLAPGAQAPQDAWAFLSSPVDPSTLEHVTLSKDGAPVAGAAGLGADARAVRFTPAATLEPGLYTFTVGAGLRALDGGPLGQPRVSTFRVGPDPAATAADLDRDGEVSILDLQVRRDVKSGRTQGTVPDFPPVFLSGTGPVEVGTVAGATVDLEVVDVDGGSVTLSSEGLPEGARLERSGEGRFTLTIPGVAAGQPIPLAATAANGDTTLVTLVTTGKRTNSGPSLLLRRANTWFEDTPDTRRAAPFRLNEGEDLFFEVEAVDLDFLDPTGADHVSFTTPSLPGVTFVERTGAHGERALYRYTPGFDQAGDREVEFQVRDDAGATAGLHLQVRVENLNQWPSFEATESDVLVGAGASATLDWIATDADGTPVEVVLTAASEQALADAVASGAVQVGARVQTANRLTLTLTTTRDTSLELVALASDGERVAPATKRVTAVDPSPRPVPELVFDNNRGGAAQGFFYNNTFYLSSAVAPEEQIDSTSGNARIDVLGVDASTITAVSLSGFRPTHLDWRIEGQQLVVDVEVTPHLALESNQVLDGSLLLTIDGSLFEFPIKFVSPGVQPAQGPEELVLELVELRDNGFGTVHAKVRVPQAHFAMAFIAEGSAISVSPTLGWDNSRIRGSTVVDVEIEVGTVAAIPATLQVVYIGGVPVSEPLEIPLRPGPRVIASTTFARFDHNGDLRQAEGLVPILPQGLSAEEQPLTPTNPYVLYVACLRQPGTTSTTSLIGGLAHGSPGKTLPLGPAGGAPLHLANGATTVSYDRSLPILLTFRSTDAGSTEPIKVLGDRIVVSMGAPHGGSGRFDTNNGFEGANDHFVPAFARPGRVEDALQVHVRSHVGAELIGSETLETEGFIPGLVGRMAPEQGQGQQYHTECYLLDGAPVWCSDTIEAWDPYLGLSALYVSDPAFETPSALTPEGGASTGTPFAYQVGEHMRRAPGFLPGSNHVHLGRAPTASAGDPPGTSFDATFQLTTSSRAIPAKTGPGLVVDFSCDGARLGDPAQAAYPQADLMIDDQLNPGVAKAGAEVFLATGEEILHRVDLVVPGVPGRPETDFRLERTYRSQIHYNASLGYGWCSDWFEGLQFHGPTYGSREDPAEVWQTSGQARVATWSLDLSLESNDYRAPAGQFGILFHNPDGTWTLRYPDGRKKNFDRQGLLRSFENRYGDTLELIYDEATKQLDYVLDAYGRKIDFEIESTRNRERDDDAHFRLKSVTFEDKVVEYEYDARDDLISVTSRSASNPSQSRQETYAYRSDFPLARFVGDEEGRDALNHNLWKVTLPEQAGGGPHYLELTYGEDPDFPDELDKVVSEREGGTNATGLEAGGTRFFTYRTAADGTLLVSVREPNQTVRDYEIVRGLTHAMHEYANGITYTTRMVYQDGLLIQRVNPALDREVFVYEGKGSLSAVPARDRGWWKNLVKHVHHPNGPADQLELVTTYEYEHVYNQVTKFTDARGGSPTWAPPVKPQTRGPARYTTTTVYDYQESNVEIPDVTRFGLVVNVRRSLEDQNGDGRTGQTFGSPVRVEAPAVLRESSLDPQRVVTELHWNESGQLLASVDPNGYVTEYAYHPRTDPDGDGVPVSPSAPPKSGRRGGYLRKVVVDSRNVSSRRVPTIREPRNLESTFLYDTSGNLTLAVDPRGVPTLAKYDTWNAPVEVTRAAGTLRLVTTYGYDRNGWLKETTTGRGSRPPSASPSAPSPSRITSNFESPVTVRYVRDLLGDVRSLVVETLNQQTTTTFEYDPGRNRTRTRSPEGVVVSVAYDERNLPFEVTRGGAGLESKVKYRFDAARNVERIEDARGIVTTLTYDGFRRPWRTTNGLGDYEQLRLDPLGQVERRAFHDRRNPLVPLVATLLDHDELGRAFRTRRLLNPGAPQPEYSTTALDFDAGSRVFREAAADGTFVGHWYDGASRLVESVDGLGNRRTIDYDAGGNPERVTSHEVMPGQPGAARDLITESVFDELGRVVAVSGPLGLRRTSEYDARGQLRVVTDAQGPLVGATNGHGNVTRFEYDGLGRLIQEIRELRAGGQGPGDDLAAPPATIQTDYRWDLDGRLTGITDPRGKLTSFRYDALSRQTHRTLPDGATYLTGYDLADNVTSTTDPNGTVITSTFDVLNRPTTIQVARGAGVVGTTLQELRYDALSRLVGSTNHAPSSGTPFTDVCEWSYDALSRADSETQNGARVASTWTADDRRTLLTYPGGSAIRSTFDPIGRAQSLSAEGAGGELCRLTWSGPGMRLARRTVGMPGVAGRETTTVADYDPALRLARLTATSPSGTPFVDRQYDYNRASVRTNETLLDEGGLALEHRYDSNYRLELTRATQGGAAERTSTYTFDPAGNRTSSSVAGADVATVTSAYQTNDVNAYTTIGGTARTYDQNGNLTSDGVHRFAYDAFDRLVEVREGTTLVAEYSYFADGRRARSKVLRDSSWEVRRYAYDGAREVAELDDAGQILATYVWGPDYVDSLVQFRRTDKHPLRAGTFFVHQDAQFNVVAVTTTDGTIVEKRQYDEYGAMTVTLGADTTGRSGLDYGFQGRRHDRETGLVYFRARYYDPATGRFISRDPVWDPNNVGNQYTFVGNSPVSFTDPSGEAINLAAGGIGALIGGAIGGGVAWYRGEDIWSGVWKGGAVGFVGGVTFGLGLAAGSAGAVALGAAEGGAVAVGAGVLTGGVVAGGFEGATAWTVGMNQGSLAENVGYGMLAGGLSAGLVHGGGMAVRAGGRYALGVGEDLLTAMRQTPLGSVSTAGGLHGAGRLGDLGEAFLRARSLRNVASSSPVHHIATNKGAWAARFRDLFDTAGLDLNSAYNRVRIPSHQGPHGWYNRYVYERLSGAVLGQTGQGYRRALINELMELRWQLRNTSLGDLIRATPSRAEQRMFPP